MPNLHVQAAGGAVLSPLPTIDERRALRDICAFADVLNLSQGAFLLVPASPALLDALAAFEADDVDLEDDGCAEPYLSAREGVPQGWNGPGDDREEEDIGEPSLASPESHPSAPTPLCVPGRHRGDGSQTAWARGHFNDLEDEHDGSEPEDEGDGCMGNGTIDDEPSLAATEAVSHDDAWRANEDLHCIDGEREWRPPPKARPPVDKVAKPNIAAARRSRCGVPIIGIAT